MKDFGASKQSEYLTEKKSTKSTTMPRRLIGFLCAVGVIVFFISYPPFEGLDNAGMASIGVFIAAIIMFVMQVAPLAVSSLTIMILLPYFDIYPSLSDVWSKFGGTSFFFLLFCFGITGALSTTSVPMRISTKITRLSKGNPKTIVYGFALATVSVSGILSNFGTLIMFYGITIMFLELSGRKPGESDLGRCLMIVLPMAAGVGGFITPAASPGNLIALSLLNAQGINVKFLDWFLICTPFAYIATLLLATMVIVIFKPESLPKDAQESVFDAYNKLDPISPSEKKAMIILIITVGLWFASTWLPFLDITLVAGISFFVMFMPGIDLIDWKTFVKNTDWNLLFMVGSVVVTMGCINTTGAMDWIMQHLFAGVANMNPLLLFLIAGFAVCFLRIFIPTAPSVAAIFVPVMIGIGNIAGGNLTALALLPVFWSGGTMTLVYTEPIYLYTFSSGYYTAGDLFKAGLIPSLIMIVLLATLFPIWVGFFGYA